MSSTPVSVLFGPHATRSLYAHDAFGDEELAVLRRRVGEGVGSGRFALVVTGPLLDELSALRAALPARYEEASRLFFPTATDAPVTRVLRSLPERVRLEIACRGLAPRRAAFCTHAESAQVRRNARKPKAVEAEARLARHREAQVAVLGDEPRDAAALSDEVIARRWCAEDLRAFFAREGYGLSEIEARWPKAHEIPSLWHQRRFHVARARDAIEAGRRLEPRAALDTMHFEDAAYAQVLVVVDADALRLASRARGDAALEIVGFEAWGRRLLDAPRA